MKIFSRFCDVLCFLFCGCACLPQLPLFEELPTDFWLEKCYFLLSVLFWTSIEEIDLDVATSKE